MKYMIEELDGLFCVFRRESIGWRMLCAFDTKKEATDYVKELKRKEV